MTLNDRCVCMVETCWRKGMCELCVASHGGVRSSVSCALPPEEYAKRKQHWEQCHDEPVYPTNTALGILSLETLQVTQTAAQSLKAAQRETTACALQVRSLASGEPDSQAAREAALRLARLGQQLSLAAEQAEAAIRVAVAAGALVPPAYVASAE